MGFSYNSIATNKNIALTNFIIHEGQCKDFFTVLNELTISYYNLPLSKGRILRGR